MTMIWGQVVTLDLTRMTRRGSVSTPHMRVSVSGVEYYVSSLSAKVVLARSPQESKETRKHSCKIGFNQHRSKRTMTYVFSSQGGEDGEATPGRVIFPDNCVASHTQHILHHGRTSA